jgi:hypothetical protein
MNNKTTTTFVIQTSLNLSFAVGYYRRLYETNLLFIKEVVTWKELGFCQQENDLQLVNCTAEYKLL